MNLRRIIFLILVLLIATGCVLTDFIQGGIDAVGKGQEPPAEEIPGELPSGESSDVQVPQMELAALKLCEGEQPALITDMNVYQIPDLPEPEAREAFRDPVFGTCVVRVTDRKTDIDDGSPGVVNEYSRIQSFNADGSRLVARSIWANWYLYDATTLQPLGRIPLHIDPRWDGSNPNILYSVENTFLYSYNITTGEETVVHDFTADFPGRTLNAVWTRYEGSPSLDSRYWGLMAEDENWDTIAYLVYDLRDDRVIAIRETPGKPSIDAVTISPLGNYFLVYDDEYCDYGQLGSEQHSCGLMVYDRNLKNPRGLLRIIGHSDTALDSQGREVLIFQNIDTDHIALLDLESGEVTDLVPIDYSYSAIGLHFSGRGFQVPGWALVSIYNGSHPESKTWMDDTVFAIELKANPRIVRLAHTHSWYTEAVEQDYWAEPHASANPEMTRIIFTSNWGRSGTEEVEMYMLVLPQNWLESIP